MNTIDIPQVKDFLKDKNLIHVYDSDLFSTYNINDVIQCQDKKSNKIYQIGQSTNHKNLYIREADIDEDFPKDWNIFVQSFNAKISNNGDLND